MGKAALLLDQEASMKQSVTSDNAITSNYLEIIDLSDKSLIVRYGGFRDEMTGMTPKL